ncbi:uncharacterized protein UHO2_00167 [Ustilago hordei]|uniref:uncharacterized protein n=1 Tax=Ustilago hordei TaxID=120017 RepID=UPI001A5883FA|nr:uncharacterized protein UHO2_00167 [Ustilago hordei]SYW81645.1 uncharacterized protein UHO2_00167 [Ustilago hordei]
MACMALQTPLPSLCIYQDCPLCFSTSGGKAVLELTETVQDHLACILTNTSAGLSIVSDFFISKYQIPTKPTKTRSIHGVTGHQLTINSSVTIQVTIGEHKLGVVEVLVANTTDYNLILGFTELRRLKPTIHWDMGQLEFKAQTQESTEEGTGEARKQLPGVAGTGVLNTKSAESARVMGVLPTSAKTAVTHELEEIVIDTGLSPNSRNLTVTSFYGEQPKCPTIHGNEFVLAECLIWAALEDGPIGFMLLDTLPSLLLAFGFVPTGADRGVEMEAEVNKKEVFDEMEADKLPQHTEHDLHLELMEGSRPLQGPLYLKGPKEMAELRKYLNENLAKGFIQPSKSPARSLVLFIPKKDGGLRLCMDYHSLNEITIKNQVPMPLIEEQLFLLRKAKIYTKLDLQVAYNLIHIVKGDEWRTAFSTQLGLYNDTEEEHVQHVTQVLLWLRSNQLFAKLSKSHFAQIAKPLTSLAKPVECFKKFELPEDAQQAFHKLIQAFTMAGVLRHFNYHLPTRLEMDASDFPITRVLKQEHEGCWHPIAFYSRKMLSAEKNYEIHNKELLTMVACLTQW